MSDLLHDELRRFGVTAPSPFWLTAHGREDLTPREERSLERVAIYRGLCGRYRAAIIDAMDQLRPDEPAYKRLALALEEKP